MPNIEIKASYPDLEKARSICRELSAEFVGIDQQTDTYFNVPNGRLKLRFSSLSGSFLIPYVRPNQIGPKKSEFARIDVKEPEKIKALFTEILGVDTVVTKTREIYLIGNVRVHLDILEGVGSFFEFEAVYDAESQRADEEKKISSLMEKFEISRDNLQTSSYQQLSQST
jgi:adenylate cyclase, class 2